MWAPLSFKSLYQTAAWPSVCLRNGPPSMLQSFLAASPLPALNLCTNLNIHLPSSSQRSPQRSPPRSPQRSPLNSRPRSPLSNPPNKCSRWSPRVINWEILIIMCVSVCGPHSQFFSASVCVILISGDAASTLANTLIACEGDGFFGSCYSL